MELPDQEIHADRQPGLDPLMQYDTVVSEQVGHRHGEKALPETLIAEPGFGLLGQPVDQNQCVLPTVWGKKSRSPGAYMPYRHGT
jgi:hypothetical protein